MLAYFAFTSGKGLHKVLHLEQKVVLAAVWKAAHDQEERGFFSPEMILSRSQVEKIPSLTWEPDLWNPVIGKDITFAFIQVFHFKCDHDYLVFIV